MKPFMPFRGFTFEEQEYYLISKHISITDIPPVPVNNFEISLSLCNNDSVKSAKGAEFADKIINPGSFMISAADLIEGLPYRQKSRDKLSRIAASGSEGLADIISMLIIMNIKNFQESVKTAIEKLIALYHIHSGDKSAVQKEKVQNVYGKVVKLTKILSGSFNEYYSPFLSEGVYKHFIDEVIGTIDDPRIVLLSDSMNNLQWDINQRILKKSVSSGNDYVSMFGERSNKKSCYDRCDRGVFRIQAEFGEEFIPRKPETTKRIERIIGNYFTPSAWRYETADVLRYYIIRNEDTRLRFEACKDSEMLLRFIAGGDCSAGMNSHLEDEASAFYSIILFDEWIGYVSLLYVETSEGEKAILIDVINIGYASSAYTISVFEFFEDFLTAFVQSGSGRGCRYLLIPEEIIFLSNSNTSQIYYNYKNHPRIAGPLKLYRNSGFEEVIYSSDFQSLQSQSFISVRDFYYYNQPLLPGI